MALDSLSFFQVKTSDRPSEFEFRQWADYLRSEFSSLRTSQVEEEKIYYQNFDVFVPKSDVANPISPVKTGSAPADADAAMDSLVPPRIIIKCKPARKKKKYQDQATKLAQAGAALLQVWRRKEDTLKFIAADMVIHRVGVARVLYDRSLWPPFKASDGPDDEPDEDRESRIEEEQEDFEIKHRKKCPIILERRDPLTVAWHTHNGEMLVVAEEYESTALQALQTFRGLKNAAKYLNQFRTDPTQKVRIRDVWYGKYRCMYLDEVTIFGDGEDGVLEHGYSTIPYAIASFRELPFVEPHKRYRGMLTNAAALYPAESNVLTMHMAIMGWNAWRTWKGWTHDNKTIYAVPGQYIPLNKNLGEYLEMLEGSAVPPEVMDTAATFDTYIQRNAVAQGPRTAEGTRSGQQLWAIQAMRALKIENAKASLAALVSVALGYALMIIEENIRERVVLPTDATNKDGEDLGEVTIKPEDIGGYYDGIRAQFVTRLDPATIEQAKGLMTMWSNNFMPWRAAVEDSGMTDNAQEWEDMIFREKAERSQVMVDLVTLEKIRAFYDPNYDEADAAEFGAKLVKRLEEKMQQEGSLSGPGGKGGGGGGKGPMDGGQMQPGSMKGPAELGQQLAQGMAPKRAPSGGHGQPARGGGGRSGGGYGG